MQSKTSFFNATVFRSDLRHWWPLTAGYTLLWLLILPLSRFTELSHHKGLHPDGVLLDALGITAVGGYWSAFFVGILFAMAAFAYLANPRATNGLHALPARRETMYVTHYLAGLCSQLAPQLFAVLLAAAVLAFHGVSDARIVALMFLSLALPTVFFYSFGVACMMFTGQILAAPVFYFVLNFLVVGMETLIRAFAGNFLYGWAGGRAPVLGIFSPMYWMVSYSIGASRQPIVAGGKIVRDATGAVVTKITVDGLCGLLLYAVVGLALAGLGLLLYRRRHSEASGNTVAIGWAKPIFKYGVAFCGAMALGQLFYELFFGQYQESGKYSLPGMIACMAAAGLIGYFLAEMLLKKSFRVFRSGWRGAAAVTAGLVLLGFGMTFDFTGYEEYIPAVDQIERAYVSFNGYDSTAECAVFVSDAQTLRLITEAHRAIVSDKHNQQNDGYYDRLAQRSGTRSAQGYFSVTYTLKGGRTVSRKYVPVSFNSGMLDTPGTVASTLSALYGAENVTIRRALRYSEGDARTLPGLRFTGGYASILQGGSRDHELSAAEAQAIYEAVLRDVAAGRVDDSLFDSAAACDCNIELYASYDADSTEPDTTAIDTSGRALIRFMPCVTAGMTETIAALHAMGIEVSF